jgi:hypothetical protein
MGKVTSNSHHFARNDEKRGWDVNIHEESSSGEQTRKKKLNFKFLKACDKGRKSFNDAKEIMRKIFIIKMFIIIYWDTKKIRGNKFCKRKKVLKKF